MPLHNSSAYMEAGVASVLAQSFADLELILIDDCSRDDTLAKARAIADGDPRVRALALETNQGGGGARNAGIEVAQGRYMAFLDSDDVWRPDKLEVQIAAMQRLGACLSYTDSAVLNSEGRIVTIRRTPERIGYRGLLCNQVIACSTAVYDAHKLGKRYFPLIRKRQDYGLWLSILRDVDWAHRGGGVLTDYRLRPDSVSANKAKAALYTWRLFREVERLSLPSSVYYFARYTISSLRKRVPSRPDR